MDGDTLYSIGELARRTGLTVKKIRFYSDRGIVAPAHRTPAGYRHYGQDAIARLALVRTLRELGVGLDVIRHVTEPLSSCSWRVKAQVGWVVGDMAKPPSLVW